MELFKTTDLLLATILKTKDFPLKNFRVFRNRKNRKQVEFHFERTPELEKVIQEFFTTDCYPFKKFFQCYKELKNLIAVYTT